jgi:hypothetical protein
MQFQEAVIVFATLAIPNSYMDFYIVSAVFYAEENEYVTMASLQHNKAASTVMHHYRSGLESKGFKG